MRKIIVEVPKRCDYNCSLAKRKYLEVSGIYNCPYRSSFNITLKDNLKPVKACRDAEVK